MTGRKTHSILNYCIAIVWIINGLFCKVLDLVPRHELIVARILGKAYAEIFTVLIGLMEILMAVWIASGIYPRANALLQILLVTIMNAIELVLAPDLLLWGKFNAVFAALFVLVIYYNEFVLNKRLIEQL